MSSHKWQGTWRGQSPAGDTHQRSRIIVRPTGGIVRGKFPSRKNGRMIHHEGLLELDAIYLFEASPQIVRYREQPVTIKYPDGARLRRYTPDFELVLNTGEVVLIEVKPMRSLKDEEVIHRKKAVRISYHSFSSGESEREIVPFSLANNGLRWHVRAYDRRRGRFIDFVLTRIARSALLEESSIEEHEQVSHDIQWNRIVSLDLVPHPAKSAHEIIAMDYGMALPERVLKVNVRAALAGYFLRQWSVDCSPSHSLDGPEIRLWLRNPVALYDVDSANLAPGYTPIDELGRSSISS